MNKKNNTPLILIFDYEKLYNIISNLLPNYTAIYIKSISNITPKIIKHKPIYFVGGKTISDVYETYKEDNNHIICLINLNNKQINNNNNIAKILYASPIIKYPLYSIYYKFNKKEVLNTVKNFKPIIFNTLPNELTKNKQILTKFNNDFFIIKDDWIVNQQINNLTDYFSEQVRITCTFANNPSPLDYWNKNKMMIMNETVNKYGSLSIPNIRETLFDKTRFCNNFRISVALTILRHFKPKSWLDISSGWGDRLLSAVLTPSLKRYVSTDPNKDLHPCYQNIINTFCSKSVKEKKFKIHDIGFEHVDLGDEMFDIVFSSPPFFTLEKYSKYNSNSITHYSNEEIWIKDFFLKSLVKCFNHLNKNGYMILYMGGSKKVFDSMFKLNNHMKYCGIIYFYDNKPRAMYVWQKINDKKISNL